MDNNINDKVKDVIDIIKNMDLKNKLRLGVCMSSSAYCFWYIKSGPKNQLITIEKWTTFFT